MKKKLLIMTAITSLVMVFTGCVSQNFANIAILDENAYVEQDVNYNFRLTSKSNDISKVYNIEYGKYYAIGKPSKYDSFEKGIIRSDDLSHSVILPSAQVKVLVAEIDKMLLGRTSNYDDRGVLYNAEIFQKSNALTTEFIGVSSRLSGKVSFNGESIYSKQLSANKSSSSKKENLLNKLLGKFLPKSKKQSAVKKLPEKSKTVSTSNESSSGTEPKYYVYDKNPTLKVVETTESNLDASQKSSVKEISGEKLVYYKSVLRLQERTDGSFFGSKDYAILSVLGTSEILSFRQLKGLRDALTK